MNVNKRVELLAPAGNMECLTAAIEAGCDAVYLAGNNFGARAFAKNFNNEEIIEAIKYSHLYGVKVYVTVNTLIYDDEVEEFLNYIDFLHKNNVDAIIIQDLGMLDLVRKTYPNLELHASTQMHIHNIEGVKLAKKLGIKRVVLARETSIDTIKKIKEEVDMSLEVFIHGALCISYSGECLMSSLIGGRSGNRGSCAGCCRQPYDLIINNKKVNDNKYLLSTKDLYTLEHIGSLIDIGVDSFKIEGRMKSREYVYMVVSIYRKCIDSYLKTGTYKIDEKDIINLKKIFNRDFTKGFLFNTDNDDIINSYRPNHLGVTLGKTITSSDNFVTIKLCENLKINDGIRIIDGNKEIGNIVTKIIKNKKNVKEAYSGDIVSINIKERVNKNAIVLKTYDSALIREINDIIDSKVRKVNIDITGNIKINDNIKLNVSDGVNNINLESTYIVEKAINNVSTPDLIYKQLNKLGESIYKINSFNVQVDDNIFIPNIVLNDLKRDLISKLNDKRMYNTNYKKCGYYIDNLNDYEKVQKLNILTNKAVKGYDEVYSEIDETDILKLPRVINEYKDYNKRLLIGELGSINKYDDFYTDFSLNVVNSYAVAFLHSLGSKKVTLSYEMDDEKIENLIRCYHERYNKHPNLELIVNSRIEAMVSKYNMLKKYNTNKGFLKDRFGNLYPIVIKDNLMYIYNFEKRVLKNYDYYYEIGINNLRINDEI